MEQAHLHAAGPQEAHAPNDHVPHVLPLKAYFGVFLALLALTALTVGVSYLDFGAGNIVVALAVAATKATLVAAVFMHLAFEKKKFNAVVFLFSLVFVVILLALTMADTERRGDADQLESARPRDYTQPFNQGKPDLRGLGAAFRPAEPAKDSPQQPPAPADEKKQAPPGETKQPEAAPQK